MYFSVSPMQHIMTNDDQLWTNRCTFSFLCDKTAPAPAELYLSPDISDFLSFAMWKFCREADMVVQPIPSCVFKKLSDGKFTFFQKFEAALHKLLTDKYVCLEVLSNSFSFTILQNTLYYNSNPI